MRFDGRCNGGAASSNGEGEQGGIGRGLPGGRMPYVVVRFGSSNANTNTNTKGSSGRQDALCYCQVLFINCVAIVACLKRLNYIEERLSVTLKYKSLP